MFYRDFLIGWSNNVVYMFYRDFLIGWHDNVVYMFYRDFLIGWRPNIVYMNTILIFLAFDFCRFCVVIWFFHPRHNDQWPLTSKDFYPRFYPNSWERASFSLFLMLSAKQGNYWYHFYSIFDMTRSLTGDWTRDLLHSMPALYH